MVIVYLVVFFMCFFYCLGIWLYFGSIIVILLFNCVSVFGRVLVILVRFFDLINGIYLDIVNNIFKNLLVFFVLNFFLI